MAASTDGDDLPAQYLPPGWTEADLSPSTLLTKTATLPPRESERFWHSFNTRAEISQRRQKVAEGRKPDSPDIPADLPPELQKRVREAHESMRAESKRKREQPEWMREALNYDEFGLFVVRVEYGDEGMWERWIVEFERRLNATMDASDGGANLKERFVIGVSNDDFLSGAHAGEVAHQVRCARVEGGDIEPGGGHDIGVGIMVNEKVMRSLLEPEDGTVAWAYAIDERIDEYVEGHEGGLKGYPGVMRVEVDVLVTDFWHRLVGVNRSMGLGMKELWPLSVEKGMYRGMSL